MSRLVYHVQPADPAAHRFAVTLTFQATPDRPLGLNLATWIPGSYVQRDFARHLLSITVHAGGVPCPVVATTHSRWEITPQAPDVAVECVFYARDASVRAAFLDDMRGFFNFTSLALWPDGMRDRPVDITLAAPPTGTDWQLVTTLAPALDDMPASGFGRYQAPNWDTLIDHPVAMGDAIESVDFTVRGVAHNFVLLGEHDADTAQLASDLAAICEAQASVFDALPATQYRFFAHLVSRGYGGLEHRESSVLEVARDALPSAARPVATHGRSAAYETLLGLASHEYFHLWNVKRIRPAAVAASDLSAPAYFRDLWAYEGITSYFDDLALVRAGILDETAYLERLAKLGTRIAATPGRARQSLAESSFDAWLKFYRPDENTPNAVVSYYGKGAQLALALDLKLRLASQGTLDLDAVMRCAWQRFGATDTPMGDNALVDLVAELAEEHALAGADIRAFLEYFIHTPGDIPWADDLAAFGIRAECEPASEEVSVLQGRLGLARRETVGGAVTHVFDDGPAQDSGVSPGDRLIAIDGLEAGAQLADRLARYPAGARLRLHLFRDDRLIERSVVIEDNGAMSWSLSVDPDSEPAARARRRAWLARESV